jgi:CRP/FNR family transcriptional regulator, cyclic AMP receptor protein
MTTDPTPYEALRSTRLAGELSDDECRVLSQLVTLRTLKQGETLSREGMVDNHLYVLLRGTLGVIKNAGTEHELTINTLSAGDFVSEMGFLDGSILYASKVALGDSLVLTLEREVLESLLPSHPWIVYRVMRSIIRVVHQIQRRLSMQQAELSNYIYKQHGRY